MIVVENLSKTFKKEEKEKGLRGSLKSLFSPNIKEVKAVDGINFSVEEGQILGFIGPNGAGKSTAIKMMTGILTPSAGRCIINGYIPYKNRRQYVKEIGVVFGQTTQLWWDLPLCETFEVLKEIYEIEESVYKRNIEMFNEIFQLEEIFYKPVRTLSLGQRMRADIAAAMIHNPKVLFLDEPTIGLDVVMKDNVRNAVKKINQNLGTTVVLTTHDMSDIELLADKIVMIDHGKMIFEGDTLDLKEIYGDGTLEEIVKNIYCRGNQ